jgi:hypothetical protein
MGLPPTGKKVAQCVPAAKQRKRALFARLPGREISGSGIIIAGVATPDSRASRKTAFEKFRLKTRSAKLQERSRSRV